MRKRFLLSVRIYNRRAFCRHNKFSALDINACATGDRAAIERQCASSRFIDRNVVGRCDHAIVNCNVAVVPSIAIVGNSDRINACSADRSAVDLNR